MDAISRLGLDIETSGLARGATALDQFSRKSDQAAAGATKLERGVKATNTQLDIMGHLATDLVARLALLFAVDRVLEYANAWQQANNQMRLVTNGAGQLERALQGVFQISQDTFTAFESNSDLFVRLQRYAGELVGGQTNALRLTKTIAEEISIAGVSAMQAQMGLIQFSQGLARGVLQGQDLKAVMEDIPTLGAAIAQGMNIPLGQLKAMGEQGRITSAEIIRALTAVAQSADEQFSHILPTLSQSFAKLKNAFIEFFGTNGSALFQGLSYAISGLADHLHDLIPILNGVGVAFTVAFAPAGITAFVGMLETAFTAIAAFAAANPLAAVLGVIVGLVSAAHQFGDAITVETIHVADLTREVRNASGEITTELLDVHVTLKDIVEGAMQAIADDAKDARDEIADMAQKTADAMVGMVDDAKTGLTQFADDLGRWFDDTFGGLGQKLSDFASGIMESLRTWFQSLGDGMAHWVDEHMGDAMRQLQDWMNMYGMARPPGAGVATTPNIVDQSRTNAERIAADRARQQAANDERERQQQENELSAAAERALRKQIEARQELFDLANAQITLNERDFAIYEQTSQLLRQFPAYYAQQAAAAHDTAISARDIAEADARSLDLLRRKATVLQQIKNLAIDQANTQAQINAAAKGADELDIVTTMQDLLRSNAEYYESMGKNAQEIARQDAAREVSNRRILDEMTRQAQRARDIARAPTENLRTGLEHASDQFWTDFTTRGGDAFETLGQNLLDVLHNMQADILRAVFEPVLQGFENAITQAMSGKGGNGSGFDILATLFGSNGKTSKDGTGGLFGGSGGYSWGGLLLTSAASFLAYQNAQNPAQQQQAALSGVGGAIGSIWGPVGSAIGSGIGSLFSGLIGNNNLIENPTRFITDSIYKPLAPGATGFKFDDVLKNFGSWSLTSMQHSGPQNHWAYKNFTSATDTSAAWGGNDENQQLTAQAGQAVLQGQAALVSLGGTLNRFVTLLQLAENATSIYRLSDEPNKEYRSTQAHNPEDLANEALKKVLATTTFDVPQLNEVRDAMMAANASFEDTVNVLAMLKSALPDASLPMSQWGQALKALGETFDELRAKTEGVADATAAVNAAEASAMEAIRTRFGKEIGDAILAIENPAALALKQLFTVQATRMSDAEAMGADIAQVMHLNELELQQFINQAGDSAEAFSQLNEIFQELLDKATAAGQATQPLIDAYNQARQGVVGAFDNSVADKLTQLNNPTLAALKALLDAQKSRLETAQAIGANIAAVDRLNAAEQKAFFDGLTEDQKNSLADYLGMIEDFTGRISIVLSQLGEELNTRIDGLEDMRQDFLKQAADMRTLSQNISDTVQNLNDRYGALTPKAGVDALRERLAGLAADARAGNDSALQALPQVGQQLIEASRALYGSTTTFRGDFNLVQSILTEAGALAGDRADTLESQAQTLLDQKNLLIEIRDILQRPDPSIDALTLKMGELDENNSVITGLLAQYLQLTAQQMSQTVDVSALYQQAHDAAAAATPAPPAPITTTGTTTNTTPTTGASTTTPTPTTTTAAADQTAQMVAVLVDVVKQGNDQTQETNEAILRQMRTLNQRLGVGGTN